MPRRRKSKISGTENNVLVLENFNRGTVFSRESSPNEEFLHRLIISPTYLFKIADGSYLTDMGDTTYPLISSLPEGTIGLNSGDGKPVFFLSPSITNDDRVIYVVTNSGRVRALSISGVARNLGQPVSLNNNYQTSLILYSNKIFFINPSSSSIYYIDENTTNTTWSSITGLYSPYLAETFSVYLYLADKNNSSDVNRRLVRVYGTSFSLLGNLDLGSSWDILDIVNNNNKFIVIFAQTHGIKSNQSAFLWDGSYQNRYFHAIKLPGYYVGSVNYMGAFLIFLQVGSDLKVYELSGYSLVYIDSFPSISVPTNLLPKQRFSVWGNYIVFPAKIKDLNINGFLMYNILEKEVIYFSTSSGNEVLGGVLSSDLNGNILYFFTIDVIDTVYKRIIYPPTSLDSYVQTNGNSSFRVITDDLLYVSNKINFFNRVKIDKIEVFYGKKPNSINDKIKINLWLLDERLNKTNSLDIVIDNSKDDYYFVTTDLGLIGNKLVVKAYYSNSTSFITNLKRIVIYYTQLS